MEFVLRCNDLKCRAQLHDRAVVTTCSHVFCTQCADTTGLSRSSNANRQCPACGTQLVNADDVVVAGLNPSEDYKTSVLSGLNPTIIMECASRGLAFYSYQASQEIIYQEHLAKSLTEKYANLNQQMDQLIHDANGQIKTLQERIQGMQEDQHVLEQKNNELGDAFREKSKAQQQTQKMYQQLKATVMAGHVATAAGDEVEYALHTARGDRFLDKIPGTRTGSANLGQLSTSRQYGGGKHHVRGRGGGGGSGSSGSNGLERGNIGPAVDWSSHVQARVRGRVHNGTPIGTPSQQQAPRSRLPVLGSTRQNGYLNIDNGPSYQASLMTRQPLGNEVGSRNIGNFGFGKLSKENRENANSGPLGR